MKKFLLVLMAIFTMVQLTQGQNADLEKWIQKSNNSNTNETGDRKIKTGLSNNQLHGEKLCGYLPIVNGKVYISEVIPVDISAEQLYVNARSWVAKSFVNAQNVIQMDDPIAKKIIVKANLPISQDGQCFYFLLTIEAREGRYKYEISNFEMQGFTAGLVPKVFRKPFEVYYKDCDCNKKSNARELTVIKRNTEISVIESLKKSMSANQTNINNDW